MSPQEARIIYPNEYNKENASRWVNQSQFRKQQQQSRYNFTPITKSNMDPFKPMPKIDRTPMIHTNNYFKSSTFQQRQYNPQSIAQSPAINSHSFFIPNTPRDSRLNFNAYKPQQTPIVYEEDEFEPGSTKKTKTTFIGISIGTTTVANLHLFQWRKSG